MKPLLLILFIVWPMISAQAIEISGNRLFSDAQIKQRIAQTMSDDSLISRITELYRNAGYFNVTIEKTILLSDGDWEVVLREGKPAVVAAVSVEITPPDSMLSFDDLASELTGKDASEGNFNHFAERCIGRMAEMGRPFASGRWREFEMNPDGGITASLRILPGPVSRVAGTIFEGMKRTRPRNLYRMLTYVPGQLYSESRASESERLIDRMPYVDIAAPFEIQPFSDGDTCYVVYHIREVPSTRFNGAAGLASSTGKEAFVGRLDIEFGDILGTGRSFGLRWNRKDSHSSELSLDYLEPYLLQSDFDLRLEISQVDRDTTFIKTAGRVGILRSFRSGLSGSLWLGVERTAPESTSDILRSNARSVAAEFDYDKTDNPLNPRSGYGISSSVGYKYRTNMISDSITFDPPRKITTAGMGGRYLLGVSRRFIFALACQAWGVVSSDGLVSRDEFAYLGGFDNLRGYAEKRFPAYRYFLASFEPRIITSQGSRVYLFADLAQIKDSQNQSSDYKFYPGYGFGAVAPSALGQFKVEIGWGKSGFPGEGVLNFGLISQF
ncbi:MAG: hypothetical protein A2W25_07985 [candidate division Zixibacteria bacterium RBG_16_53_22]|nr:MAG: hypothetical protein A2W25_07985 [candidate division Zixibacteria bacterium RBG_16_53_22]